MKLFVFTAIVVEGLLGFAIWLYGTALYDDGWPW